MALGITKSNFDNMWIMILVTNVAYILPLPMLACVKIDTMKEREIEERQNGYDTC